MSLLGEILSLIYFPENPNYLIIFDNKIRKAGDKEAAKNLLTRIIKQDPNNARAWYLLSQAVDQKEYAIYCLEQVQKLYPDNEKVKQRLLKPKVPNDVEPKSTDVAQVTDTLPPTQISWAIDRPEQPEPAPA